MTKPKRTLKQIIRRLRQVIATPVVSSTLIQTEDLALLCDAAEKGAVRPSSVKLAAMNNVYQTEHDKWFTRTSIPARRNCRWEIVRLEGDVVAEEFMTIISLALHEALTLEDAKDHLKYYRGIAAMKKALEVIQ